MEIGDTHLVFMSGPPLVARIHKTRSDAIPWKKRALNVLRWVGLSIIVILQARGLQKTSQIYHQFSEQEHMVELAELQMMSSFYNATSSAIVPLEYPGPWRKLGGTTIDERNRSSEALSVPKSFPIQEPKHVVFYNVFIPKENPQNSIRIVREHVDQINNNATSGREELFPYQTITILYYNRIGLEQQRSLPIQCPHGMECRFLKWYESGFEEVTLTDLHNYCRENPKDIVTYLHNKGSLHNHSSNNVLRRISTRASLSSACLRIGSRKCNVCGLQYQHHPHLHYSTNMWTAKCNYVRQLVSPHDYAQQRRQMCLEHGNKTVGTNHDTKLQLCERAIDPNNDTFTQGNGLGRFAMEYWISSHPNMLPCQVFFGALTTFSTGWEEEWKPGLRRVSPRSKDTRSHVRRSIQRHVAQTQILYPNHEGDVLRTLCPRFNKVNPPHPCIGVVQGFTAGKTP